MGLGSHFIFLGHYMVCFKTDSECDTSLANDRYQANHSGQPILFCTLCHVQGALFSVAMPYVVIMDAQTFWYVQIYLLAWIAIHILLLISAM